MFELYDPSKKEIEEALESVNDSCVQSTLIFFVCPILNLYVSFFFNRILPANYFYLGVVTKELWTPNGYMYDSMG